MNIEVKQKEIWQALKIAEWHSKDISINYNFDVQLGFLFADGNVIFFDDTVLEFTESITPEREKYRFQYMDKNGRLIFRYDNLPHHKNLSTFPDHKHYKEKIFESPRPNLRHVVEEIIEHLVE